LLYQPGRPVDSVAAGAILWKVLPEPGNQGLAR